MLSKRLIKSNNAGAGACTNTVDLYNPFPDGGGVALYQLNGDATDVSGNYNGTASNVTYGAGQFGQAAVFNGSSSSIDISTPPPIPATNTDCSFSCWFLNNGFNSDYKSILGGNGADALRIILVYVSTNTYRIEIARTYNNNIYYGSYVNTTILPSVWYHLTVTYTNNIAKVYLNNNLIDTINLNQSVVHNGSTSDLKLGVYRPDVSFSFWDGSIDQVRIFSRELRPYEVEALYTEEYCTPTIVPSQHFNTVTYTAATTDGTYDITGSSFQPDLIWVKNRDNVEQHYLIDSVRGLTNMTDKFLQSSTTNSESSASAMVNGTTVTAIDGGFRVVETNINSGEFYFNGRDYVAWNFKAGGAAVTNTDGTITSQVSANTEAGFSIVSYTGNGANGTVGHGLGVTPNIVLTKRRDSTSNWSFNGNIGGLIYGTNKLALNDTAGIGADTNEVLAANSNNFTAGTSGSVGASGGTYIAYCFAEVEGFSSFGSYVGTGASGNTIVTGFEPAFVMVKITSGVGDWWIFDNKRTTSNPRDLQLRPNSSAAESNLNGIDFLENGFNFNSALFNDSGVTFIYMAFAADPTAVEPTLEDSFNTVVYSGTGTGVGVTNSITGVGFQPDLVWVKSRTSGSFWHNLADSVRGVNRRLFSNTTNAEDYDSSGTFNLLSFDNDGFTVGRDNNYNDLGTNNYVAWNWKAAEIPAINSNGSIPSVVSANPAAGFSIVSWTSTGSNTSSKTVGHGLENTPSVVILKNRSTATSWRVYHSGIPSPNNTLALNSTEIAFDFFPSVSSTNFGLANSITTGESSGASGQNIIAYCFAEVAGFSKFGSYTGTGGVLSEQTLGFEPAFIMFKRTDSTGDWFIYDNKRDTTDPRTVGLYANLSAAEYNTSGSPGYADINFLSNGFSMNANYVGINGSGGTFIYMAFANQF